MPQLPQGINGDNDFMGAIYWRRFSLEGSLFDFIRRNVIVIKGRRGYTSFY
jgi:hypothetical protein